MPRVKRGTKRRANRKKTLALAQGFFLNKSKLYRAAQEAVERSLRHGYIGRKHKKREFRSLWIVRINAACRNSRDLVQQIHRRIEKGRYRPEPESFGRHCRYRRGGFPLPGRACADLYSGRKRTVAGRSRCS